MYSNKISKELVAIGLIFALVLGLYGVIVIADESPENLAESQVLSFALGADDVRNLDPHFASASQARQIVDMIFNGWVRFKPGTMDPDLIEPDLATSWDVSDDGLVWTFHFRKGVQFQKGYGEFTAEDAVFSLKKAADPETSGYSAVYDVVKDVEVLDKYTARVTLKHRVPDFLGLLADYQGGFIISKKAYEELGSDTFMSHPVGTGPFQFSDYVSHQKVVLQKHKDYFRGEPSLDKVVVRFMPDPSSRLAAFRKGQVNLFEGVREAPWIKKAKSYKDTEVIIFGPGELVVLHMNTSRAPLNDLNVRKAIAYAISREKLATFIGKNVAEKTYSVVPPNYLGGLGKEEIPEHLYYEYNPTKAKELLKKAGYPDGFSLEMVISEESGYLHPMKGIQAQLREVGIKVELNTISHATYHSQIRKDVNPLAIYMCARFPIADSLLTQFYYSKSIVGTPTGITNFSHYKAVDDLIETAKIEPDSAIQKALWAESQLQLLRDVPAYPLYRHMQVFVKKPWVDLGHKLNAVLSYYPGIKWNTKILEH